jgi:hypothetical protein
VPRLYNEIPRITEAVESESELELALQKYKKLKLGGGQAYDRSSD